MGPGVPQRRAFFIGRRMNTGRNQRLRTNIPSTLTGFDATGGAPPPAVPEPGTIALLGFGTGGLDHGFASAPCSGVNTNPNVIRETRFQRPSGTRAGLKPNAPRALRW